MATIAERYSTALEAKSLKVDPLTSFAASDVLGAAGMAAQAHSDAMLLWSVLFQNKTSAKLKAVDMLAKKLKYEMMRNKEMRGSAKKIAEDVFAWHMNGTCQPCGGRGFKLINGSPSLSNEVCPVCLGTGKVKLPRGEAYTWLSNRMGLMISYAGGKVMKKIKVDLDSI